MAWDIACGINASSFRSNSRNICSLNGFHSIEIILEQVHKIPSPVVAVLAAWRSWPRLVVLICALNPPSRDFGQLCCRWSTIFQDTTINFRISIISAVEILNDPSKALSDLNTDTVWQNHCKEILDNVAEFEAWRNARLVSCFELCLKLMKSFLREVYADNTGQKHHTNTMLRNATSRTARFEDHRPEFWA